MQTYHRTGENSAISMGPVGALILGPIILLCYVAFVIGAFVIGVSILLIQALWARYVRD